MQTAVTSPRKPSLNTSGRIRSLVLSAPLALCVFPTVSLSTTFFTFYHICLLCVVLVHCFLRINLKTIHLGEKKRNEASFWIAIYQNALKSEETKMH